MFPSTRTKTTLFSNDICSINAVVVSDLNASNDTTTIKHVCGVCVVVDTPGRLGRKCRPVGRKKFSFPPESRLHGLKFSPTPSVGRQVNIRSTLGRKNFRFRPNLDEIFTHTVKLPSSHRQVTVSRSKVTHLTYSRHKCFLQLGPKQHYFQTIFAATLQWLYLT